MRLLLDQIEQSLNHKLYYLSLMAVLAIPDIAGALDSDDGCALSRKSRGRCSQYSQIYLQQA